MLFIEDLARLPEKERMLFAPRAYTSHTDLVGHYIYAYLRKEADAHGPANSVYYVGEGKGKRVVKGHTCPIPTNDRIVILVDNITKAEGQRGERILVKAYGRVDKGTGILLNKTNGGFSWGTYGKTFDKSQCQFCGEPQPVNTIAIHERCCESNPDRVSIKFDTEHCQFCGDKISLTQLSRHERHCHDNPNRIDSNTRGRAMNVEPCSHCGAMIGVTNISSHERCCDSNPDRVDDVRSGRTLDKRACCHCDELFGITGINEHERTCSKNPDRVGGVNEGRRYDKESCQYCSREFSASQVSRHERTCSKNPERVKGNYPKNRQPKLTSASSSPA